MSRQPAPMRARKRFGQNFLQDHGVIERIVGSIHPREGDRLVEIGPGQGALTEELLAVHGSLEAIELDRDLIPGLRTRFFNYPDFNIIEGDALAFDFRAFRGEGAPLRVVGNLPYNISTPLIFHLLSAGDAVRDMHFMLQKEVVARLAAQPGTGQWGRLSVMTRYYCQVESLFDVPPEAFLPQPKVDSSIVRLVPWQVRPHVAHDETLLSDLVRRAFSQRRKTLRNNLRDIMSAETLESLEIAPTRRPETLSVGEFVTIANHLSENAS
ncbi:16S rRNA (adenine(1518)-N(6)/adenine(1519)-N(6))-dimethyltransferase RsmA [Kushneria marisflavi]|uniref:Ribosomal RNA small subunit methyltransferase A n=1 Tax=Kushneria marisflavi TaxID=157779 RepID=A0A240UM50_9GAMM|nr:16S rRNA (adenine(1518)-N(6)/adenine(1519)-N(6))-dimethyltransferase RsmA [Kushneria marisflavi]ART62153.1 16S rRNA (adenine(1518)-N(6)/adenine(1519)-N(6))-dimethyltransferase [Kushneria marisflavi]RKD87233.1 dimethyladenosine transferase [Kushneria marisflavi]